MFFLLNALYSPSVLQSLRSGWLTRGEETKRKNIHLTGQRNRAERETRLELGKGAGNTNVNQQLTPKTEKPLLAFKKLTNLRCQKQKNKETNKQPHTHNSPYHFCLCCDPNKGFKFFFFFKPMQRSGYNAKKMHSENRDRSQTPPRENQWGRSYRTMAGLCGNMHPLHHPSSQTLGWKHHQPPPPIHPTFKGWNKTHQSTELQDQGGVLGAWNFCAEARPRAAPHLFR